MNLLEQINEELKYMHFTEFEKVRYIYLRCCEIFSFDSKWHYTWMFDDDKLKEEMRYKVFDLENIDSDLIVCHSFSRYILKPLIENFTNLEAEIEEEGDHSLVTLDYGVDKWEMDATIGDLARVKAKVRTNGFSCDKRYSNKIIDELDQEIGYKRYDKSYFIERLRGNTHTERMKSLSNLLSRSDCRYHFSDASFFVTLFGALNAMESSTYVNSDYMFYKLIKTIDENYFLLDRKRTVYNLHQIEEQEFKELKQTLKLARKKKSN